MDSVQILMYSYWNFTWVDIAARDSDFRMSFVVHRLNNLNNPFIDSKFPHRKPVWSTRSKAFSRSTNARQMLFFFCKNFSCSCLSTKIASVIPLPGIKPNSMLLIETCSCMMVLRICSRTSIKCSCNLRPL